MLNSFPNILNSTLQFSIDIVTSRMLISLEIGEDPFKRSNAVHAVFKCITVCVLIFYIGEGVWYLDANSVVDEKTIKDYFGIFFDNLSFLDCNVNVCE